MDLQEQGKHNLLKLQLKLLEDKCQYSIAMKEQIRNQWEEYSLDQLNVELGDALMSLIG